MDTIRLKRNIKLLRLLELVGHAWPMGAVIAIFFHSITNDYSTAALLLGIHMLVNSFTEIPTGIISDRWTRKQTLMVGYVLMFLWMCAFAWACFDGGFVALLAGVILWGLSDSFISGTDDAILMETLKDLKSEKTFSKEYSIIKMCRHIGLGFAMLLAMPVLYFWDMEALVLVCVAVRVPGLFIVAQLTNPNKRETGDVNPWRHFKSAVSDFTKTKALRRAAFMQIINKGHMETLWRIAPMWCALFLPLYLINFVAIIMRVMISISFALASKWGRKGIARMGFLSHLYQAIIIFVSVIINSVVSPFLFFASYIFAGGSRSAEATAINDNLSDTHRATMNSFISIFAGIVSAVMLYLCGIAADKFGFATVFYVLCAMQLFMAFYWKFVIRR